MTVLAVTNTLSNGATILASEHNTNYSDIVTYINNRNTASATWDAVSVANGVTVPLVVNNSGSLVDIARFQDNGSNVLQIFNGGFITMASQPSVRAYRNTSGQSTSGLTKVQFNAESFDVKSEFDSATNYRYTATKAGKYLILATVNLTSLSTGPTVHIYINGASVAFYSTTDTTTGISHSISGIHSLAATDYVEIYVDGSGTVANGSDTSYMAIHKLA